MENDRVCSEKVAGFKVWAAYPRQKLLGLRQRNLKTQLISSVRPTIRTNPSRKRGFSKTLFDSEEFDNAGFSF